MAQALRMAHRGLGTTAPNPAVGAVVFDPVAGCLVGRGVTQPGGRPHAEPVALAAAGTRARGATMAVTLEPCSHHGRSPPCVAAILDAGLARLIYAQVDPDPRVGGRGLDQLRAAGVAVAACNADQWSQAAWLTRGHILRVTERRPFVQLKLALGPDGQIAPGGDGRPTWVTGPLARRTGHLLRAQADAIVVGTGTVLADDPELTCRLPGLEWRSPLRVVVGDRPVPSGSRLASGRGPKVWLARSERARCGRVAANAGDLCVASVGGRVWLPSLMEALVEKGITRALVEGGPELWRAFGEARLIDEIVLFHARGDRGPVARSRAETAIAHHCGSVDVGLAYRRAVDDDDMFVYRVEAARGWTVRQTEKG